MREPLLEYDASVDAAYLTFSDAKWSRQERLDDARAVNYSSDGSLSGSSCYRPNAGA